MSQYQIKLDDIQSQLGNQNEEIQKVNKENQALTKQLGSYQDRLNRYDKHEQTYEEKIQLLTKQHEDKVQKLGSLEREYNEKLTHWEEYISADNNEKQKLKDTIHKLKRNKEKLLLERKQDAENVKFMKNYISEQRHKLKEFGKNKIVYEKRIEQLEKGEENAIPEQDYISTIDNLLERVNQLEKIEQKYKLAVWQETNTMHIHTRNMSSGSIDSTSISRSGESDFELE